MVLSLGCEYIIPEQFEKELGKYNRDRIRFLTIQKVGDEVEIGLSILRDIYSFASQDVREDIDISELVIGLKCGGSDGYSGITANPLLGRFSDYLIANGGTTILTEVTEMFGAEHILMNRAENEGVFQQIVEMINGYKTYLIGNGQPTTENPSPGNIEGGISTLEEKSIGCTQKCGTAIVNGVLYYGEPVKVKGLSLLSCASNDLVSSTGLASSGCHIVLFTTGRGTPFGTFVPTVKIATNTDLATRKPNWIDFNAGVIVESESIDSVSERFIDYIIRVASGELTNQEKNGYCEIIIYKHGVTL